MRYFNIVYGVHLAIKTHIVHPMHCTLSYRRANLAEKWRKKKCFSRDFHEMPEFDGIYKFHWTLEATELMTGIIFKCQKIEILIMIVFSERAREFFFFTHSNLFRRFFGIFILFVIQMVQDISLLFFFCYLSSSRSSWIWGTSKRVTSIRLWWAAQ